MIRLCGGWPCGELPVEGKKRILQTENPINKKALKTQKRKGNKVA
jgi:hypothetical protein